MFIKHATNGDQQRLELATAQGAVAERIARYTDATISTTASIPGLTLHFRDAPTDLISYMMPPSVCLIGQGQKRVLLGDEVYVYDAHRYLITSVDLQVIAQVTEASPEVPYLGLSLQLDLKDIRQLMVDHHLPSLRKMQSQRGMAVSAAPVEMLGAFVRLLDLLSTPADIPILAPLIQREICYRLLMGEQGPRLRLIAEIGSQSEQIARAIDLLKGNFAKPFKVEDLASEIGMSSSTFHHHFKEMTALSPLQFLKRLRLNEARRLMLTEHHDAASAALYVGYESPSQFSREYSRQFGAPPLKDIKSLTQAVNIQQVELPS
jgi:AraC-like DNA-binding protein